LNLTTGEITGRIIVLLVVWIITYKFYGLHKMNKEELIEFYQNRKLVFGIDNTNIDEKRRTNKRSFIFVMFLAIIISVIILLSFI